MQDNLEKPKRVRIFTHNIKKETNMDINKENKQHIHELLIKNMQLRLNKYYKHNAVHGLKIDGKSYENALELMCDNILLTNTLSDVNKLVIEYSELFDSNNGDDENIFTLEGTMNYVLSESLEYYSRFNHKVLYRPEFN